MHTQVIAMTTLIAKAESNPSLACIQGKAKPIEAINSDAGNAIFSDMKFSAR